MIMSCDTDRNRWLELNLIHYLIRQFGNCSNTYFLHRIALRSLSCSEAGGTSGASAVARRGNLSCSEVRLSMAHSKMENIGVGGDINGIMIKATAYIAKFSIEGPKVRVRPSEAGVHKKNRGGEYPAGLRAKELLIKIATDGIIQDEVDHHGYAVEEMPLQEMMQRKDTDFISTLEYNIRHCAKDELLSGIYNAPYDKAHHGFLAHNHVMTVCRAVMSRQLWRLEEIADRKITFCDPDGRLSLELIAGSVNCQQIRAIITDGILCRILNWKMDVEEPDAAAIISTAFNELGQVAMRTTELQAFQVLKGEIIIQMSKDVGQAVAFQTVLKKVTSMLGPAADDPDVIQLFDFLISNGVGKNSYIDDFLHWATVSINPNKRRLRFAAFIPINKMCALPLSRCAVAKRAYRGKPIGKYCPNPESVWGSFTMEQLTPLEEILRFFHVKCKGLLNDMAPKAHLQLLGNVDIAAAEAFHIVATAKSNQKKTTKEVGSAIQNALLKATFQWASELDLCGSSSRMRSLADVPQWIVFKSEEALEGLPAVAATQKEVGDKQQVLTANVVHFDEASGKAINQTPSSSTSTSTSPVVMEQALPWQAWQKVYAEPALMHGADYGSAVAVLNTLAAGVDTETLPLEVCDRKGKIHVRATRKIPANELMLAPSTANGCSLVNPSTSTPDHAVDVVVRVQNSRWIQRGSNEEQSTPQEQSVESAKKKHKKADKRPEAEEKTEAEDAKELATEYLSERWFKLMPEWRVPGLTTAAQKATQAESGQCHHTVEGNSLWPPTPADVYQVERSIDDYTWGDAASVTRGFCATTAAMGVYWGIRRMSSSDLEQANKVRTKQQSFNCRFEMVRLVNVCVGLVSKRGLNQARNVEVPFITNAIDVEAGEELLLERQMRPRPASAKKAPVKDSKWKTQATKSLKKTGKGD